MSLSLGLLGRNISQSLSPRLHQFFGEETNTPLTYQLFDCENEASAKLILNQEKLDGLNITAPYKALASLSFQTDCPNVAKSQSANTIVFREKKAYSTDGDGLLWALERLLQGLPKSALVVGAGGAARAVLPALKQKGIKLYHYNRTQGRELPVLVNRILEEKELPPVDVLIQASTQSESAEPFLKKVGAVYDMNYQGKEDSSWVKSLKKRGILAQSGHAMLVAQGAKSFTLWSQKTLSWEILEDALLHLKK